ncbi:family 43 glycosylhydrolase [Sphingobacterium sp. E70]|nr:family 43 glycosylhydrolase [Sphingobacterium sp. E70]ULT26734.1 family 43 glycosylhydrolase [Sphingobacterium sp. E70]
MNKLIKAGSSCLLGISLLFTAHLKAQENPFIKHMYTADPSARVWADGRLYVYASHDIAPPQGCDLMDQYHVFSTADMKTWTDHGEILRASQVPWGRKEGGFMWAPDCVFRNGTYYFYFPHPSGTEWNKTWKIGVATSKSPAKDFVVQGYVTGADALIDPHVFIDDDGQAYFYQGGGGVCKAGKLKDNMMEVDGQLQRWKDWKTSMKLPGYISIRGNIIFPIPITTMITRKMVSKVTTACAMRLAIVRWDLGNRWGFIWSRQTAILTMARSLSLKANGMPFIIIVNFHKKTASSMIGCVRSA